MLKYLRRFTKGQKFSILSEHFEEGVSISEFSRKHQVSAHSKLPHALAKKSDGLLLPLSGGNMLSKTGTQNSEFSNRISITKTLF